MYFIEIKNIPHFFLSGNSVRLNDRKFREKKK